MSRMRNPVYSREDDDRAYDDDGPVHVAEVREVYWEVHWEAGGR